MHNSGQSYSDLFINYTYTKIEIIPVMDTDLFRYQCDIVVQPAKRSLEQFFCCRDVSFGYSFLPNYQNLACVIDKIVQNNWVIMQSDKAL